MATTYAKDGVNIPAGDALSALAAEIGRTTWDACPYVTVRDFSSGHFRGVRGFQLTGLPENVFLDVAPDGIGTKSILIAEGLTHDQAAANLVSMTGMDLVRAGAVPLLLTNVLDVGTLGGSADSASFASFAKLLRGLGDVCRRMKMVMYKGETAELNLCVGGPNDHRFNWAGFALGAYDPARFITGNELTPGQIIVAFKEDGFRCNGFSSVRAAFAERFGPAWGTVPEAREYIALAAAPSALYEVCLAKANGWYNSPRIALSAIVHITGGGIPGKLGDILSSRGLSANLDGLFDPPSIMRACAEWRNMPDRERFEVWNGGQGALAVVPDESAVEALIELAEIHGIQAQVCGCITESAGTPTIQITSGYSGEVLVFEI